MKKHVSYFVLSVCIVTIIGYVFFVSLDKSQNVVGQSFTSSSTVPVTYDKDVGEAGITEEMQEKSMYNKFDELFVAHSTSSQYSNIVGYFAEGAFVWYVPDWLIENWEMKQYQDRGYTITFTPKEEIDLKKVTQISFYYEPSSETFNAATMYDESSSNKVLIKEILLSQHKQGTLQILIEPETRIYHLQEESINMISDLYMMDGNGYTLRINFSADKEIFNRYANKIRDMVEGISESKAPQG